VHGVSEEDLAKCDAALPQAPELQQLVCRARGVGAAGELIGLPEGSGMDAPTLKGVNEPTRKCQQPLNEDRSVRHEYYNRGL
jgi:hypothetical protein